MNAHVGNFSYWRGLNVAFSFNLFRWPARRMKPLLLHVSNSGPFPRYLHCQPYSLQSVSAFSSAPLPVPLMTAVRGWQKVGWQWRADEVWLNIVAISWEKLELNTTGKPFRLNEWNSFKLIIKQNCLPHVKWKHFDWNRADGDLNILLIDNYCYETTPTVYFFWVWYSFKFLKTDVYGWLKII